VVTRPASSLAQDRESSPAETSVLPTLLRRQRSDIKLFSVFRILTVVLVYSSILDLSNPNSIGFDTVLRTNCSKFQVIAIRSFRFYRANIIAHIPIYPHDTRVHRDEVVAISASPYHVVGADRTKNRSSGNSSMRHCGSFPVSTCRRRTVVKRTPVVDTTRAADGRQSAALATVLPARCHRRPRRRAGPRRPGRRRRRRPGTTAACRTRRCCSASRPTTDGDTRPTPMCRRRAAASRRLLAAPALRPARPAHRSRPVRFYLLPPWLRFSLVHLFVNRIAQKLLMKSKKLCGMVGPVQGPVDYILSDLDLELICE